LTAHISKPTPINKYKKVAVPENALFYTQQLHEEIQAERRVAQERKALKNLTTAQKKTSPQRK
jgi:hypothetical protein